MLYNCLEWYKWVLTNLSHDRQLYNTLIPPSHESPAVGLRISRLSGSVELTLRYTTPDIRCRHRRHECDGGIKQQLQQGILTVITCTCRHSCNKSENLQDKSWLPGCRTDSDCIRPILWSRILLRKTGGVLENVEFCISAASHGSHVALSQQLLSFLVV